MPKAIGTKVRVFIYNFQLPVFFRLLSVKYWSTDRFKEEKKACPSLLKLILAMIVCVFICAYAKALQKFYYEATTVQGFELMHGFA